MQEGLHLEEGGGGARRRKRPENPVREHPAYVKHDAFFSAIAWGGRRLPGTPPLRNLLTLPVPHA